MQPLGSEHPEWHSSFKEGVRCNRGMTVSDFKNDASNGWNLLLLREFFEEEEVMEIQKVVWPDFPCEDKLLWVSNNSRGFSVQECYKVAYFSVGSQSDYRIWDQLWKSKLHERLKMFLWRMLANVIPTREVLLQRVGGGDRSLFCDGEMESLIHIFKECHYIWSLAFASFWGLKIDQLEVEST